MASPQPLEPRELSGRSRPEWRAMPSLTTRHYLVGHGFATRSAVATVTSRRVLAMKTAALLAVFAPLPITASHRVGPTKFRAPSCLHERRPERGCQGGPEAISPL